MESWKKHEIALLKSDIVQCLLQLGYSPVQAQARSISQELFDQSSLNRTDPEQINTEQTNTKMEYLNMRVRRIRLLAGLDPSNDHSNKK